MTVDWLTHGCDLSLDEMQDLAFATVVAVLSTVQGHAPKIADALDQLSEQAS
jgi:hypothetical protein